MVSDSVGTKHLFVAFILLVMLSTAALRQNNIQMGELRDDVLQADELGEDISEPLRLLQEHVTSHMNTRMAQPLNLVGSFNRAVEEERKKAEQTGANPEVYQRAQEVCENPNVVLSVRAQCIQDYVTENAPEGTAPEQLNIPPKELFIYDFRSPAWSPDLAGWSMVLSVVAGSLLAQRAIARSLKKEN